MFFIFAKAFSESNFLQFMRFNLLTIFRPVNFLITFISGFLAVLLAEGGEFTHATLYFGVLIGSSAALIGSGGNIINDILDQKTDKINRPDRPLPSGDLTSKSATRLYIFCKISGVFLASIAGIVPALIAAFSSFILFFYSYSLKSVPLAGNLTVAFLTGLVFIFGASAVNNYENALFPFIFSFLINLIREIVKDIEDVPGDSKTGITTFPVVFGVPLSKKLLTVLIVSLIIATFLPFIFEIFKIEYLIIITLSVNPALVLSLKSLTKAKNQKDYSSISSNLKFIMFLGIFAILLGL
ncbi:MAG: geranylgeranylglycerol-phosphate geranylgeranyltransferase [Ignavibacteriales bacterium]|nr:geranylgeranylglycerol-phosphate geranylgeranyltransferase [Ignavibacteriales bacterium]